VLLSISPFLIFAVLYINICCFLSDFHPVAVVNFNYFSSSKFVHLDSHGLCNDALHLVYRSTVIGKLLYAVNAWWGFTSAADRQRMEALVKRGVRSGLCAAADSPNLTELIKFSDDALFNRVLCNQDHILFPLLPDERNFTYNFRKRNHNRLLTIKQGHLCSCNFITRMLFKACY